MVSCRAHGTKTFQLHRGSYMQRWELNAKCGQSHLQCRYSFNGATRTKKRCTNNLHKITTVAGQSTSSRTKFSHRSQLIARLKFLVFSQAIFPPSNNGWLTSKVKAACWALPAFPLHFTPRLITSRRVENDSALLDSVSQALEGSWISNGSTDVKSSTALNDGKTLLTRRDNGLITATLMSTWHCDQQCSVHSRYKLVPVACWGLILHFMSFEYSR